jgi:hypothetical protein
MTQFQQDKFFRYLEKISALPEKTATERERKAQAFRHLYNAEHDNGAFGRVEEILSHSHGSKITRVRKQGQVDTFVKVDGKRYGVEYKTNGGRIESLYSGSVRFVVYSLDICNATTSNKPRHLDPVVLRTETFLEILEDCGAIKCTNGKNPERAVQPSSKKMFEMLVQYGTPFNPEQNYCADEIN